MRSVHTLESVTHDLLVTPPRLPGATWFKILASTRRLPDGSVLFNGGWLDITQEKNQSLALAQAKQAAETAALEQSRFLATISHEIRTP
jgi:signal transduction histidine kinase